ncbi:MAG: ATPase, T2SS/T4P/T4SS family [Mollicutes bacterium]|nr:ATPase, T2SS/T4P/T4SS family [Mollicutes bacterium]
MMVQFDVKRVQKGTESFMVSFDFTKTPVTQVADYIIIAASKLKTSDIHFDPREDGMMVRFRIDGDCQDYTFVPKAYEKNLTTRLKLLANMNITESRLPQDGAIKGEFGGTYLDMRVSSLPLNEGEKIVIRILDYTRSMQGIDSLGFHPENLKKIKRMMEIPNGIILTTGATGSGKSTTTYSILQGLNKPEKNIITVEDPIEMNIEGINQVQVNAEIGMTFAAALRSILRQDPNIILIGEIRDSETAQIAVRASITGHLVLSTIHTNNALATVERLLDMNVERYLLSTALTGIISQRLAKMLCPDCRFQRETTPYEKKVFKKFIHMDVPMVWDANPKGCDHCRRGYHGRIAFHEVLELDDDIRNALNIEGLEKKKLAKMVYTGKTITMLQDALIKCYEGQTSFEEVYRNIEIETEDDEEYESEIGEFLKDVTPPSPEGEDTEEEDSDELIDTIVNKNDKNNISNMMSTPVFTASDFNDTPVENANTSDKVQQNVQKVVSSQGVTVPKQVQNTITNSTPNPQIGAMVSNTKPTQTAVTIPNDFRTSQGVTATIPTTNVQNNYNQSVAKIPNTTKTQQYPAGSLINTNSVKTVATTPITTPINVPTTYQVPTTAAPISVPISYQNPATVPVTAPVTSPATSPSYGTAVNNIYKMPTINPQPINPNVQVQTTIAPPTSSNAYSNTGYTYNVGQVSSVTPTSSNTNTGGTLVNINGMPRLDDKKVPLVPKI